MVKMADPVTLWPDLLITLPTTHYVTNSEDMTMLQILIRSQVRIVVTSQAPHNRAMAGWMLGFTSSPNRHFWMTWSFIGRRLYMSTEGHYAGTAYSVLGTVLACTTTTAAVICIMYCICCVSVPVCRIYFNAELVLYLICRISVWFESAEDSGWLCLKWRPWSHIYHQYLSTFGKFTMWYKCR